MGKLTSLIFLPLLALSLQGKEPERANGLISMDSNGVSISLVDPDAPTELLNRGCRFTQGAWIKSASIKEGSWSWRPLMESTVFDYHQAFGIPEELTPSIKLADAGGADSMQLVLGVGKTLRHGENVFKDSIASAFPWRTKLRDEGDGGVSAEFEQSCKEAPYGYELRKTLKLLPSGVVAIDCRLENTGSRKLEFQSYLHPFLRFENAPESYFYSLLDCETPASPEASLRLPLPIKKGRECMDIVPQGPSAGKWLLVANSATPERFLAIKSGTELSKIRFWMKDDCFSVEPFTPRSAEPGAACEWSWLILLR